jgi:hypothetical protein
MGPLQDSNKNPVFQSSRITDISAFDFKAHMASNYQTKCDLYSYCSLNIIRSLLFLHIHYVIQKN